MTPEIDRCLQIFACREAGYHPQVWTPGWRVAFLNETPKFRPENICDLQRHNTSDEVFILLQGNCTLYVGDGGDGSPGTVTPVPLEAGKMYNVRRGVWHTHVLGAGAKVAVIENADVSPENTDRIPFALP